MKLSIFSITAALLILLISAHSWAQQANEFEGTYTGIFEGSNVSINKDQPPQDVAAKAEVRIEQSGQEVTVHVGGIGSAMSATRFTGKAGNGSFVALHRHPTKPDQIKMIWGQLIDGNIQGQLVYPRVATGLVPGMTDLNFQAYPTHSAASEPKSPRTLRPQRKSKTEFRVIEQQVQPKFIPMPLPDDATQPEESAGQSIIYGEIRGALGKIVDVQLVDPDENTLQSASLASDGKYRFENIAPGRYWIFVNDGKSEAWVTVTSGSQPINADGSSSHRLDFKVQ